MWKLLVFAAAGLALVPVVALAHGGTEVIVSGHVHPDGPIAIEGEEFAANDQVVIELQRAGMEAVVLGEVSADDEGAFRAALHVPARVAPGFYQLVAAGEETAFAEVTVERAAGAGSEPDSSAPEEDITNDRPAAETIGLAITTAVLAVLALFVLWRARVKPSGAREETSSQPG